MSFQWSDPEPHYRRLTYGDRPSDRYVILWGSSNTPIAFCDDEKQAKEVCESIQMCLAQIAAETNAEFTSA